MNLVLDASVALKWILNPANEPNFMEAHALLRRIGEGIDSLFVPPHWHAEIVAVVTRLQADRIEDALDLLFAMPLEIIDGRQLLSRAARLSVLLEHHLFDTLYHAVAIECDATLVTADRRYFDKAQGLGNVRLLAGE